MKKKSDDGRTRAVTNRNGGTERERQRERERENDRNYKNNQPTSTTSGDNKVHRWPATDKKLTSQEEECHIFDLPGFPPSDFFSFLFVLLILFFTHLANHLSSSFWLDFRSKFFRIRIFAVVPCPLYEHPFLLSYLFYIFFQTEVDITGPKSLAYHSSSATK